jgi:hypothetical protein
MNTSSKSLTILESVADALADGCCQMFTNGECCMSDRAREMFTAMNQVGGPSLEECEAIARGDVKLTPTMPERP